MEFDRQKFTKALDIVKQNYCHQEPTINNQIFTLHLFDTLPSTNQKLWQLIEQGAPPGTIVIAKEQQAGKGQWGRQWYSPPGGLYLSMSLTPNLPAKQGAQLTMSTAWGIAQALRQIGIPVYLKWPNDLVISKYKLGGILTETRVQQERITKAVIGVGINWVNPVPETGINLQNFLEKHPGLITSLEMLAALTLTGIISGYNFWQKEGVTALLPSYEKLLNNINSPIEINGQPAVIVGVSENGDLRVRINSAEETTPSEIHLPVGTISLGYA
ncbi:biotin--[acetyl-CoA-carboxylase] ligase [[Phormidium ambiguum] IAM M-71]|uniref:biotin--[acetyl-CoA-carboxylase] ligase n=1 Tax=[Phormidium ambiguum] IAM M-71 TaxID=454136 RepID=UPI001F011412|nr:biotin--[acetyl-CoA-carboxylase] ligase [Phormidium ambiguum]